MIDRNTLESILHLSRLDVDEKEKESFQKQVGGILDYFDLLKNYDTSQIDVDLGKSVDSSELREDTPRESYSEEKIEGFAIHFEDNYFTTPRILEELVDNREDK